MLTLIIALAALSFIFLCVALATHRGPMPEYVTGATHVDHNVALATRQENDALWAGHH